MLDELEWPSLEARRDRSSLLLLHKIHCGNMSIEKDKYLTPAHSFKSTRSSDSAQYCRYQTNSDALKNSFSPGYSTVDWTIAQWNSLSPSMVNSQNTEEFMALLNKLKHMRKCIQIMPLGLKMGPFGCHMF